MSPSSAVVSDREIVIDHANWLNDGKVYLDQPVLDVSEDNDWSAVPKVWYAARRGQYGAPRSMPCRASSCRTDASQVHKPPRN